MAVQIDEHSLSSVPATMLIPLWARARMTARTDALITDHDAVRIMKHAQDGAAKLDRQCILPRESVILGIAIRTRLIDSVVLGFLQENPDGLIVNLGCGLDARGLRIGNDRMHWVDVDVPESIMVRKAYYTEAAQNIEMREGTILRADWLDDLGVRPGQKVLLVMEGTTMYFTQEIVQDFLKAFQRKFPGAEVCMEILGNLLLGRIFPAVKALGLDDRFGFGLRDPHCLADWDMVEKVHSAQSIFQHERHRWPLILRVLTRLVPSLQYRLASVITHFSLTPDVRNKDL